MISRKIVQGLKNKLQSIALGVTGRKIKVIEIPKSEGELGYTSKGNEIHLSFNNKFMDDMNKNEQIMFVKGVFAHELMHQEATDFSYMQKSIMALPPNERKIFSTIFNIAEDPAIENLASYYIGGSLLKALSFAVMQTYKRAPEIEDVSPFSQFISASVQYGDGGFLKGDFYSQEAKECFFKSLPWFDKIIEELDAKKRIDYSKEIFEITRPLWEEEIKNMDALKQLFEEIEKSLEQNGKNLSGSGGSPNNPVSPDEENSSANEALERKKKRRKITVHRITEEEAEKMGLDNSSNSGEIPDGDIDVYVVEGKNPENDNKKNSNGLSIPSESKNNTEDNKSESENSGEKSKNDISNEENGSADEKGNDEGEKDENNNSSDSNSSSSSNKENNSSNTSQDQKNEKNNFKGTNKTTYNPYEYNDECQITDEEYELTDEDIKDIKSEIEDILFDENKAEDPLFSESLDIPDLDDVYKNVSCKNIRVTVNSSNTILSAYDTLKESMSDGINHLTNQLKRIFKNDVGEKQYTNTGRLNVKRLNSGTMTPRVFNKRKNPANKADLSVIFLIDESGSMHGLKSECARNAAIGLTEVFGNLHIPTSVIGFTTNANSVMHYHYLHWKNTLEERLKLLNIRGRNCNFDGYSIRYASKLIEKRPEEHKLMIVISDGLPSFYSGEKDAIADTAQAIREVGKKMDIIGVAIGDTDTNSLYALYKDNFLHIANTQQLYEQLGGRIKQKIKRW